VNNADIHEIIRKIALTDTPGFANVHFCLGRTGFESSCAEILFAVGPSTSFQNLKAAEDRLDRPTVFIQLPSGWPFLDITMDHVRKIVQPNDLQTRFCKGNLIACRIQ
jgi:hypothetical protein